MLDILIGLSAAAVFVLGIYGLAWVTNGETHEPKLTKDEQHKLLADLDEWRLFAIEYAQTPDLLDKVTKYYEARRTVIERGRNPGDIREEIKSLTWITTLPAKN